MFYYIYKTTNTINGKYYLGMHQHETAFDPKYLGSGVGLAEAIKKHGRDAFNCEVIEYCSTREEMFEREKALITEEVVRDNTSYNRNIGGRGGAYKGRRTSNEKHKAAVRAANLNRVQSEACKEALRERNKNRKWYNNGTQQTFADESPEGYKPGMLKRSKVGGSEQRDGCLHPR